MVTAVILAAGVGKRMNQKTAKQYIDINGKPILYYTIKAFEASNVDSIIIVCGGNDIEYVKTDIIVKNGIQKVTDIIKGGKERFDSSYNGIRAAGEADYILIHDGARPCISPAKINEVIDAVQDCKACILGVPVKDTIKITDTNGNVVATPDRDTMWQIQTPQAFEKNILEEAYRKMYAESADGITDDSMVVEKYTDTQVKVIMGEYENIKVTTPEDLQYIREALV